MVNKNVLNAHQLGDNFLTAITQTVWKIIRITGNKELGGNKDVNKRQRKFKLK